MFLFERSLKIREWDYLDYSICDCDWIRKTVRFFCLLRSCPNFELLITIRESVCILHTIIKRRTITLSRLWVRKWVVSVNELGYFVIICIYYNLESLNWPGQEKGAISRTADSWCSSCLLRSFVHCPSTSRRKPSCLYAHRNFLWKMCSTFYGFKEFRLACWILGSRFFSWGRIWIVCEGLVHLCVFSATSFIL